MPDTAPLCCICGFIPITLFAVVVKAEVSTPADTGALIPPLATIAPVAPAIDIAFLTISLKSLPETGKLAATEPLY